MAIGRRSILVVEELAHWSNGHFPVRCAQLATAYAELGYSVELLTSEGWARRSEHADPPFTIRRYRPFARLVKRVAVWLPRRLCTWTLTVLEVCETRARERRMTPPPEGAIVLSWRTDPVLLAAIAGRRRWLVFAFRPPDELPTNPIDLSRVVARKRSAGGRVVVAVPSADHKEQWLRRAPSLDPVVMRIAGTRDVVPFADARDRVGVPESARVALLFGEAFVKQRDVVFAAFDWLRDWTLVVGGTAANDVVATDRCLSFPGVVSDDMRDALFASADLVVLSYPAGHRKNSGTLTDAISFGVPVVCSDDTSTAEVVKCYRLGSLFRTGDARSLAEAVRHGPTAIDPDDLERARHELSNEAVARQQLRVLGVVDDSGASRT